MRTITVALLTIGFLLLGVPAHAQTRAQFEAGRHKLVDEILVPAGITNQRVAQAMRDTPRHELLPLNMRSKAYFDMALPIGDKQTIARR